MRVAMLNGIAATVFASVLGLGLALAPAPALAMGGSDSGGSSGGSGGSSGSSAGSGGPRLACPSGWKLSADKKRCLRASSGLERELPAVGWGDEDNAFLNAAVLAHSGDYTGAIAAFEALGRPDDPYVLNYLGFSHRKLGEVETALTYYDRALEIRPDYVRARQYLGEGYLALRRLDDAKHQLEEIAALCGVECEPYILLRDQIGAYEDAG